MPIPVFPPQRWNPYRIRGENRSVSLPPRLSSGAVLLVNENRAVPVKWTKALNIIISRNDLVFLIETTDPLTTDLHIKHLADGANTDHVMVGGVVRNQVEADKFLALVDEVPSRSAFVRVSPVQELVDLELDKHTTVEWVIADNTGDVTFPIHPDWVRTLRDQCLSSQRPFRFEGWGDWVENIIETSVHERVLHVPRDPTITHLAIHPTGQTAFTLDNPVDPFTPCDDTNEPYGIHAGWTVLKHVGAREAGRELDGKVYDEAPLLGCDRID